MRNPIPRRAGADAAVDAVPESDMPAVIPGVFAEPERLGYARKPVSIPR